MAEECADCGATFGSAAELVAHMKSAHAGGDATASMAMNPASETPTLTCGLCGRQFYSPEALAAHNLEPHEPTTRPEEHRAPA